MSKCPHNVANYEIDPETGNVWCFACRPPRLMQQDSGNIVRPAPDPAPVYLPGDRILYAGQPATVICGHADGLRLYIRIRGDVRPGSGDDLLVEAAACTPAEAAPTADPPRGA